MSESADFQFNGGVAGEFAFGAALVSPALRSVTGPGGRVVLEPKMMDVLVALSRRPGSLVTRGDLIELCWGGAAVGDDSINRAIAGIRRAARTAGQGAFEVETVFGSGYVLVVGGEPSSAQYGLADNAIAAGWRAWRLGLPAVNRADIEILRAASRSALDRADVRGMLALLLRHAVEYADAAECAALVDECEEASRSALAAHPGQPEALAALAGLWPIYGDWERRREALLAAFDAAPGHRAIQHDLVVLEMSTGRTSVALGYLEDLYARDQLAAIYHYKLTYQYWTLGRLADADRVADRAMQLWPRHPAIWFGRFWHLSFSGRAAHAAQQLRDEANRPPIPPAALAHLEATVAALLDPSPELRSRAVAANLAAAQRGPAQSVHALIQLSGLGEVDAAFEVARGYYLRSGPVPVAIRKSPSDPTINELHRRATQALFIPTGASMRADPRFLPLCEEMGLADYWRNCAIEPEFLAEHS